MYSENRCNFYLHVGWFRWETVNSDMDTLRLAVTAINPDTTFDLPIYALQSLWVDRFVRLRQKFVSSMGVQLHGIQLRCITDYSEDRDFKRILGDLGLGDPLSDKVRFLISDEPITVMPNFEQVHQLVIAIELSASEISWSHFSGNSSTPLARCPADKLYELVCDIVMDFAICNSFPAAVQIGTIVTAIGTLKDFYAKKAEFVGKANIAPYVSFSHEVRNGVAFGSDIHLSNLVSIWDKFYLSLLSQVDSGRMSPRKLIAKHPKFGGQISPYEVDRTVDALAAGTHVMLVRKMSCDSNTSKAFKDLVGSVFESADYRSKGGKEYGVFSNRTLPSPAQLIVQQGAAYAVRFNIGG